MVTTLDKKQVFSGLYFNDFKKINIFSLGDLGYILTNNQIPIGVKPYRYGIMELRHEDRNVKDVVSFSYLFSTVEQTGIILPYGFDYYLSHPVIQ